jgi:O-antigen/teichoic acid export membrane protein
VTVEKAAKAGVWSAADIVLRQGVNFFVLMVMARLLTPADFGIVALVTFFSSISIVFVQGGLSQALIQRQQTSREEESAVFWWNLGGSALFGGFLVLIAPWVASFYGYPVIQPLMIVAAAQILFASLGAVQTALLTRALRFRTLTVSGAVASVASGAIGIGAATAGLGLWALALQLSSLALVSSIVLWIVCDWRPLAHFRFATIRSLFGFGIYLSLSSALDVLYTQGFALIIGKLHGVSDLGLYNRAHSTQALPSGILGSMVGRTAFPLFSARASDREALRRGVRMANSLAMIINLPAMMGLCVLADLVIISLFGDQWVPSAPLLSILAIGGILLPLHTINLQVLLARAESRQFLKLELIKKAVGLLLVVLGSWFGVVGLAWAALLFGIVALPINTSPVKATIGYGAAAQLWDLRGLIVPAAAMTGAVWALKPMLGFAPPVSLAILSVAGAAVYFGVGVALGSVNFVEARKIGLSIINRSDPKVL